MKKRYSIRILSILLVLLTSICSAQVTLETHAPMNVESLRFWYQDPNKPDYIFNPNIAPKGDCIQVLNGYVFFTWFKGGMQNRNLMLSRLNIATNKWVTINFLINLLYIMDFITAEK